MDNLDVIDVSNIKFESAVFPTVEDMQLWDSLNDHEKHAVIMRDVQEGLDGPAAKNASKDALIQEVLSEV